MTKKLSEWKHDPESYYKVAYDMLVSTLTSLYFADRELFGRILDQLIDEGYIDAAEAMTYLDACITGSREDSSDIL